MARRNDADPWTAIDTQVPGPLYPDRCLECSELTRETYGSVCPLRCADCAGADLACRRRARELELAHTGG